MSAPKLDKKDRKLEILPGCIVCKTCEFMAPEVFVVEEKTLSAKLLKEEPTEEELPGVIEAIKNCPEKIIKFRKKKD
jgi:ferredoxin